MEFGKVMPPLIDALFSHKNTLEYTSFFSVYENFVTARFCTLVKKCMSMLSVSNLFMFYSRHEC